MKFFKAFAMWMASEERQDVLRRIERLERKVSLEGDSPIPVTQSDKPYRSARLLGDSTVIIVLHDGATLVSDDISLFSKLKDCKNEEDVVRMFVPKKTNEPSAERIMSKDLSILEEHEDFEVEGENVYMKGISVEVPAVIVADFIEILEKSEVTDDIAELDELEDMYQRMKFFWCKLVNSPVEDRDNVLLFCKEHDVRLTRTGNIIAYRRLVSLPEEKRAAKDLEFDAAVVKFYDQVMMWGKNPQKYVVYQENSGEFQMTKLKYVHDEWFLAKSVIVLGTVGDLNEEIGKRIPVKQEIWYTSAHNRGKYKIRIGDVYEMKGETPNPDLGNCAAGGLHAANVSYDYSGYGDTPVVVLINPSKAIHVPTYDNGKFRTSEMKIACINPNSHGVHIDEALIERADKEYNQFTIDQLREAYQAKSLDTLSIGDAHVPEVSMIDIRNVIKHLEERVVMI